MKRILRIFITIVAFLITNILFLSTANAGNWSSVACGYSHSLAIKTTGTLWAWGSNLDYQLGLGDNTQRTTPTQIGTAIRWSSVYCGSNIPATTGVQQPAVATGGY